MFDQGLSTSGLPWVVATLLGLPVQPLLRRQLHSLTVVAEAAEAGIHIDSAAQT
jgi:hypothetical protein